MVTNPWLVYFACIFAGLSIGALIALTLIR
jgi:hypothetical protein